MYVIIKNLHPNDPSKCLFRNVIWFSTSAHLLFAASSYKLDFPANHSTINDTHAWCTFLGKKKSKNQGSVGKNTYQIMILKVIKTEKYNLSWLTGVFIIYTIPWDCSFAIYPLKLFLLLCFYALFSSFNFRLHNNCPVNILHSSSIGF